MGTTGPKIAVVGAGAVGSYVGGFLAHHGHDVTLIDGWPENVQAIREKGLRLVGMSAEEAAIVAISALNITEVQALSRHRKVDIVLMTVKSYDTAWATTLIQPHLASDGYIVSLQNCLNEETIAGIVGWGKTLGAVASRISVSLYEPGCVRRTGLRRNPKNTVFRVGEVHGRVTPRLESLAGMLESVDNVKLTTNLWGERWSKLCANVMGNGVSAASGLGGKGVNADEKLRRLTIRLGGEAIKVGYALGFALEEVQECDPGLILRAAYGDAGAMAQIEGVMLEDLKAGTNSDLQRPSMGQDIVKSRSTEIDFINGLVAAKGCALGINTPANTALIEVVKAVERGERRPSPDLLYDI